jgi:toxin-antitoxin system PIN domain toxin
MIAVDTNILVHANRAESRFYRAAYRCLATLSENTETWAIPWPCVHEFLSVVTKPRAFARPTPLEDAIRQVDVWFSSPSVIALEETKAHWSTLSVTLRTASAIGGAIHDARIATLCIEHGVRELWTADRDFSRYSALATFNPLLDDRVHETRPTYGAAIRARTAGRRTAVAERSRL